MKIDEKKLKLILLAIIALGIWTSVVMDFTRDTDVYVSGGNIDADVKGEVDVNNKVDVNLTGVNGRDIGSRKSYIDNQGNQHSAIDVFNTNMW